MVMALSRIILYNANGINPLFKLFLSVICIGRKNQANMYKLIRNIIIALNFIRCLPHLLVFYLHPNMNVIKSDILVWLELTNKNYSFPVGLIYLLGFFREYRNLFYYRIGWVHYILNIFCRKMPFLSINAQKIGEGFFINHGYATIIGAKSIGKFCRIGQQVTIGENLDESPVILDNVSINSGAIIVGNITIGSNSVIGANATVLRDVPDNSTVYAPLPIIMKWNKSRERD